MHTGEERQERVVKREREREGRKMRERIRKEKKTKEAGVGRKM